MSSMSNITQSDTSRIFADWGRAATLIEVFPFYDPATGQLEESESTTEIVAIPTETSSRQMTASTAHLPIVHQTLLVRESELPSGIALTSSRIRWIAQTLEIVAVCESSLQGVLALQCATDHRREVL